MKSTVPSFRVTPENTCLETLSPLEIASVVEAWRGRQRDLIARCVLAVLNSGAESDNVRELLAAYHDFDLELIETPRGLEVELKNAPAVAFVHYEFETDRGTVLRPKLIEGLREHIFSVIRDLAFVAGEIERTGKYDLGSSAGLTDAVFLILRNAGLFTKTGRHKVVTCWGGHAIDAGEYQYSLEVGNQCGLRFMDVITGCGPGAMRGPMEGATIGHAKQRMTDGRYIGITEPGIIASEAPNPIVNPLVIMPDIEKRLEAFVRLGQGLIVFPGGVGTLEEISYILSILTHPKNRGLPFPLIFTGPESARDYWAAVKDFLPKIFGPEVDRAYRLIVGNPEQVVLEVNKGLLAVKIHRDKRRESYYFNTGLHVPFLLQEPFVADHRTVARTVLKSGQTPWERGALLRRIFSAVVSGNVRPEGIRAVEAEGPFRLRGDRPLISAVDGLLTELAAQGRMSKSGAYRPSYVTEFLN
jgi:predicted Rossmann-fold nucleotide-binding protein